MFSTNWAHIFFTLQKLCNLESDCSQTWYGWVKTFVYGCISVCVCPSLGQKLLLNSLADFRQTWWVGNPRRTFVSSKPPEPKVQLSLVLFFAITPKGNIELTLNLHRYNVKCQVLRKYMVAMGTEVKGHIILGQMYNLV